MTLILKEFEELKNHFYDTVDVMLENKVKHKDEKKIDDLEAKRREEILFLKTVLEELVARKIKNNPTNLKPYVDILYGAQFTIKQDIKANLYFYEKAGLLNDRLNDGMQLSEKNSPDDRQLNTFHRSLNQFLKFIFKHEDSRDGLDIPNVFTANKISIERLAVFANTSYQLELEAQTRIIDKYLGDGQTVVNANDYRADVDVPVSAIAQFSSFDELKLALHNLIKKEIGDKGVATVTKVKNEDRIRQLQTLEVVANTLKEAKLESISEREKIGILAGFMLSIREDIGTREYEKKPFDPDLIPGGMFTSPPVVHTGLTKILKCSDICREDAEALIQSAKNFITFMTIERTEVLGEVKECARAKHIFSDIAGFKLADTLNFMNLMIKTARTDALNQCVETYNKELDASMPKKPSLVGYLTKKVGGLGFYKAEVGAKDKDVDDFDDEEENSKTDLATAKNV